MTRWKGRATTPGLGECPGSTTLVCNAVLWLRSSAPTPQGARLHADLCCNAVHVSCGVLLELNRRLASPLQHGRHLAARVPCAHGHSELCPWGAMPVLSEVNRTASLPPMHHRRLKLIQAVEGDNWSEVIGEQTEDAVGGPAKSAGEAGADRAQQAQKQVTWGNQQWWAW